MGENVFQILYLIAISFCCFLSSFPQGVPLELFVRGARACMDLVSVIESRCGRRMRTVDIGGGLSTTYKSEEEPEGFTYALYRQRLQEGVPGAGGNG